jgi:hypothetical protein
MKKPRPRAGSRRGIVRKSGPKPSPRTTQKRRRTPKKTGIEIAAGAKSIEAVPVTAEELRALQRELQRRLPGRRADGRGDVPKGKAPMRWNPDPEDVQKSVAQLVLTIVEFLRKLMERQAVRRMEAKTLTPDEVEAVGTALMRLEETVHELGSRFGLTPEDLNLDLGPIKLM